MNCDLFICIRREILIILFLFKRILIVGILNSSTVRVRRLNLYITWAHVIDTWFFTFREFILLSSLRNCFKHYSFCYRRAVPVSIFRLIESTTICPFPCSKMAPSVFSPARISTAILFRKKYHERLMSGTHSKFILANLGVKWVVQDVLGGN